MSPDNLPEMVGGTECQLLPLGKGGTLVFMQITALNRVRGSLREKLTFLPRRWTHLSKGNMRWCSPPLIVREIQIKTIQ